MIMYFLIPNVDLTSWASFLMSKDATMTMDTAMAKVSDPSYQIVQIWRFIIRPIAIGGMLVSAAFTLFRMRKSLSTGIARSVKDVKKAATGIEHHVPRNEKDISFGWIMIGIIAVAILTFCITYFIFDAGILISAVAATLMIILAFFFASVSGYLVGIMGSSNNPISGLTLTALVVTALILVALGVQKEAGVATVLGVAAIVCVSAAVAGEMLQDLKAGHILGGTPWRMQVGDILGVILAGAVMFVVLAYLNEGDIASGKNLGYQGGFGSKNLPAPQASLMAILSRGIVQGQMAWPLIIAGMLMGTAFILMQVKSPMLVSVGMYLPIETTFAIFAGGLIKGLVDLISDKRKHNPAQKIRIENTGVLLASGLIAGEALMGLVIAIFAAFNIFLYNYFSFFKNPTFYISFIILAIIAYVLTQIPLKNAGKPDEPAPPAAGM
jgi:putative OPT family oligopeptide transporter